MAEITLFPVDTVDDLEAIAALSEANASWTYQDWIEFLNLTDPPTPSTSPRLAYSVKDGDVVVGYMGILLEQTQHGKAFTPERFHVSQLGFAKDRQGQGLGTMALRAAISAYFEPSAFPRMTLRTQKSNVLAISLYEALGFELVEEEPDYYEGGGAALFFQLTKERLEALKPKRRSSKPPKSTPPPPPKAPRTTPPVAPKSAKAKSKTK